MQTAAAFIRPRVGPQCTAAITKNSHKVTSLHVGLNFSYFCEIGILYLKHMLLNLLTSALTNQLTMKASSLKLFLPLRMLDNIFALADNGKVCLSVCISHHHATSF